MLDIVHGVNESPISTRRLLEMIENIEFEKAILYIGYPIIGSLEDKSSVDALLISKNTGIVIFDIVEGDEPNDRSQIRDELYSIVSSKLFAYPQLVAKRGVLSMNLNVLTFAPAFPRNYNDISNELVKDQEQLNTFLNNNNVNYSEDEYKKFLEVIQSITKLRTKATRKTSHENSKGYKLNKLEKSIANLDSQQSKAVIETTKGIQRIRGLAGSGKTIILALKVAYLHSKYRDWTIGVTFYTRSLKQLFNDLVNKFTIEQKNEEPDWNKIKIMQAWGSPRENGFYYEYCFQNNIEYLDFDHAKRKFGTTENLLDKICYDAINASSEITPLYDVILIDEAQDFSENFLKLAYNSLKYHDSYNRKNRMLVYAYDELQNLSESTIKHPKEIFGEDIDFESGRHRNKPTQDVILDVCYRNSGPVLTTAHALGFGIYRDNGLVTMFKDKQLWLDVGYKIDNGNLEYGQQVVLKRDNETSPEYYKDIDELDNLIITEGFADKKEQYDWVAKEIKKNIREEDLEYRDIIVIHPDPLSAQKEFGYFSSIMIENDLQTHLAGVSTSPDKFYLNNSIVFTSIYRAKGNEAPMIYIVNSDFCYEGLNLQKKRNTIFTAVTRSKCWVRLCGIGEKMNKLKVEINRVRENSFKLDFVYPTAEEMDKLNIIHRELSYNEEKEVRQGQLELKGLLSKLQGSALKKEDLSEEDLRILKSFLND